MSKYTTEVRFICESKADKVGGTTTRSIDEIINTSWDSIFTTKCKFFDEAYRSIVCKKILKHYYFREICAETVSLWEIWVNTKLEEIMPYYNQLYESALLKFNPLYDVDYTRDGNRQSEGNTKENNKSEKKDNGTTRDLYSDTPQGALTGVESETYLTNARKTMSNLESDFIGDRTSAIDNTEDYIEHVRGKMAGKSYSKMLKEFRETLLNIDMMIVREFEDLFFMLW